jgi:hypothetical protein
VLIGPDSRDGSSGPGHADEVESHRGLDGLLLIAILCAASWLGVALIVFTTIVLRSTPAQVALALLAGLGAGLFPTLIYRRREKLADAALRAIAAEAPEQVLIDARARNGRVVVGKSRSRD